MGQFFCEFWLFSRENPAKSADFSANLPLKIPRNFAFFPRNIRSPDSNTYSSCRPRPSDKGPWDPPWISHCTALTLPKIISSKPWLLKSWHMCRTHLIWKKKWSSSSAIGNLASSGTNSRVALDWEIRISILKPAFGFCNHTRNLKTDLDPF